MFRGTTARTLIPLLAAVLIALPFLTLGTSFASAHTDRDAVANARSGSTPSGSTPSGSTPSGTVPHDETVTCPTAGRSGEPAPAPRVRDRHRPAAAPQPEAPLWPPPRQAASAEPAPALSGAAEYRPRRAADLSAAALQVFRC
ncbi:hypothetical protein ACFQ9U_06975 [Streptomyces sp. NPDC056568]|uniref:hypothetical protein n=1 Tax=Streptomyces sp. NPDC056568 TaxID=3345866 RepID=UPI0036A29BA7